MRNRLKDILTNVSLEEIEPNIYSVLKEDERASDYDDKVKGYDALIGNGLYNKLIWRNDVANYHDFCVEALNGNPANMVLDAGCGSLVFTAKAYASSTNQQIVLLDRSLGMLRKAKERLEALCEGKVPEHIVLIQGDIFDLPFVDNAFDVVMSQGLLHMFDDKEKLLTELERVKQESGTIFFTSLVGNNLLAKGYLFLLKKAGEVATVYDSEALASILKRMPFEYKIESIGNMAYMRG